LICLCNIDTNILFSYTRLYCKKLTEAEEQKQQHFLHAFEMKSKAFLNNQYQQHNNNLQGCNHNHFYNQNSCQNNIHNLTAKENQNGAREHVILAPNVAACQNMELSKHDTWRHQQHLTAQTCQDLDILDELATSCVCSCQYGELLNEQYKSRSVGLLSTPCVSRCEEQANILSELTPCDLRVLVHSEEELSQVGLQ